MTWHWRWNSLGILAHLYISLSQPNLAHSLLTSPQTTAFTSDSLLSQLLTARANIATGPKTRYEQAYYVYEEIKGMQGGRGETTLAGLAVAEASLGRWDEAVAAVTQALELVSVMATVANFLGLDFAARRQNDSDPTALANLIALARYYTPPSTTVSGAEPMTVEKAYACVPRLLFAWAANSISDVLVLHHHSYRRLQQVAPQHPFLVDLASKDEAFEKAASAFGVAAA